jgi:hypothetical protein
MPRRMQALGFTEGSAMKHFEKMADSSYWSVGTRAAITLVVASVLLTAAGWPASTLWLARKPQPNEHS